ncbi:MAG: S9 family peptidase [Wenzhouxiangellaceae bacterium]
MKHLKWAWLSLMGLVATAAAAEAVAEIDTRVVNNGNMVLQSVPPIPAEIGEEFKRYQNVRSARVYDWSQDSASLYIGTRFADVLQIHRVDQPGGARRQLTWFDEPVREVNRRPGTTQLSFTMDSGGSEFSQIYLLDTETGEHHMLTDGKSRNFLTVWSDDGRWLAFQSTRRNGRANDIWLLDNANPESARLLIEAPGGSSWVPVAFSADNRQLLILQYVSVNDSRIHVLNLDNNELVQVAGDATRPSRNLPYGFSADGAAIYYTTDAGSEFAQLAHRTLDDRETTVITADIPWSVSEFVLNHRGDRGAFVTNEGGISQLYQYYPANQRYQPVDAVPVGIISDLTFSPDDSALAFSLNNPVTPSDVYVLSLTDQRADESDLTQWTESEVGGLDTTQFASPELIEFPTFDQVDGQPRMIPAFIYRPDGPGPHPVVISIHGGPEGQYRPYFSSTYQLWAARLGVAVAVPNVRGSAGYGKSYLLLDNGIKREDSVKDIGSLLDWIATQDDLDADRVAVYGGSYGGYMVLASAVHYSDRLKAAIDIVGISNFVTFLENTQDYRRDLRRMEYGDERDPAMREHLQKISPLTNVDRIKVPMLVAQGHNDPRVPYTEAEQIVAALRQQGTPAWYVDALNEGHGFRKKENRDLFSEVIVLFLQRYLLGEGAEE